MSMRRLRGWLLACLCGLAMTGSPAAWAVLCSQVFPANATQGGVDLTTAVDAVFASQTSYSTFPTSSIIHYDSPGQWVYQSASLGTRDVITVKAGATTWLFFDGDLNLQPQSSINPFSAALNSGGNPEDLIIIVRGTLNIGTNNVINALMYATGDVIVQPNANIAGAITAKGTVTVQNPGNTTIAYDADAAASFDMPTACSDQVVDHFRLDYGSPGLTCQPHSIQVSACGDAACSTRVVAAGAVVARNTTTGTDLAYASFTTDASGSAVVPLSVTTAATVSLRVGGSTTQCTTAGCLLAFSGSALRVTAPDLIAGQADTLTVSHCDAVVANSTLSVQFWSAYLDPVAGNQQVFVNGSAMGRSQAEGTTVSLSFVNGSATVPLRYADAGQLQLQARTSYTDKNKQYVLAGASRPFVSRPYALRLLPGALAGSSCFAAGGALSLTAPGCNHWPAGDDFSLGIQAVAADGSTVTPNFRLDNVELGSALVAPADGVNGSLSQPTYNHLLGNTTTLSLRHSEAGIFRLSATPRANAYFGYTVAGGEALVGRFTPAYLGVTSTASLTPACGAFSYQGQVIPFAGGQPQITVSGYNRQGVVTSNYDRAPFWRLAPPQRQPYSLSSAASKPNLAGRLQSLGVAQSLALADSGAADGSRAFDWPAAAGREADALLWALPSPPTAEDLPFVLSAAGEHVRLGLRAAQLTDADGICYRGSGGSMAACQDFSHAFGGSEVRLGRLRIDDASGPGNQALDLPYWLESWQPAAGGPAFGATVGDSCSQAALGAVALADFTGDLQASHFPTPPGTLEAAPLSTPQPTGVLRLQPPYRSGSVLASLSGLNGSAPALPWLRFDWNGDGSPEAPAGRATFGEYASQRAIIFRREVYR